MCVFSHLTPKTGNVTTSQSSLSFHTSIQSVVESDEYVTDEGSTDQSPERG